MHASGALSREWRIVGPLHMLGSLAFGGVTAASSDGPLEVLAIVLIGAVFFGTWMYLLAYRRAAGRAAREATAQRPEGPSASNVGRVALRQGLAFAVLAGLAFITETLCFRRAFSAATALRSCSPSDASRVRAISQGLDLVESGPVYFHATEQRGAGFRFSSL